MNEGAGSINWRRRSWLTVGTVIWLAAVGLGMEKLLRFSETSGDPGAPPARWPRDSRLPRQPGLPTMVVLAHPHCPCTRASLEELGRAMVRCRDRVTVYVLFLQPDGVDDGWVKTDLWDSAAAIPGVTVLADVEGLETRQFGAATSGQVLLYDVAGKLLFSGGITQARGHAGDNPGREALVGMVAGGASAPRIQPVFGCSMRDPAPREGRDSWNP